MSKNRVLLIDGNSMVYRAYYGSAYGPSGILTNSKGFPVNAILTFTRTLLRTIKNYEPTHVFVAFDAGKKTKRHDKMPDYKAGRSKTPQELIDQMPVIKTMLSLMNIKTYELKGIEADDIVGSLSTKLQEEAKVLIMSSDKDLHQLVTENATVIAPQNGAKADKIFSFDMFEKELGYKPSQVPDIKALVGDPSDNLKGVSGIGAKGAQKLISQYGNIENIYDRIDEITGATKTKLEADKASAFLCKEIATIWKDIEVPFNIEDLIYSGTFDEKLLQFYENYEVNSLVKYVKDKIAEKHTSNQIKDTLSFDNLEL